MNTLENIVKQQFDKFGELNFIKNLQANNHLLPEIDVFPTIDITYEREDVEIRIEFENKLNEWHLKNCTQTSMRINSIEHFREISNVFSALYVIVGNLLEKLNEKRG